MLLAIAAAPSRLRGRPLRRPRDRRPDRKAVVATVEPVHQLVARARIGGTIVSLEVEGRRQRRGRRRTSPPSPTQSSCLQMQALDARIAVAAVAARQGQDRLRPRRRTAKSAASARRSRSIRRRTNLDVAERNLDGDARRPQRDRPADERGRGAGARRRPGSDRAGLGRARRLARRDDRDAGRRSIHPAPATARAPRPVHARRRQGAIGSRGLAEDGDGTRREGKVRIVYPEIQGGRVIADVEGRGLGDYFVGERTLVYVEPARGATIVVPAAYVFRRAGVNYVETRGRRRDRRAARRAARRRQGRRNSGRPRRRRHVGRAMKLGLSGALTRAFIRSPLTPLLLLAALAAGALAARLAAARGRAADQRADGRHHGRRPTATRPTTRSSSSPGRSRTSSRASTASSTSTRRPRTTSVVVTARFLVGTDQDTAVLRVHEKIRANIVALPKGIPEPLIVGRGINDVAIVDLTLSAEPAHAGRMDRQRPLSGRRRAAARTGQGRQRRQTYIVGGSPEPDPRRARPRAARALRRHARTSWSTSSPTPTARSSSARCARTADPLPSSAGQTLQGVPDIGLLLLTTRDGRPVYVKDVANVVVGAAEPDHRAWTMTREQRRLAAPAGGDPADRQAQGRQRRRGRRRRAAAACEIVKGRIVPRGPRRHGHAQLRRDRDREGQRTAVPPRRSPPLSIVVLITLAIGWREGVVVLIVIPTTILLTMFASWLMGYTINRVSLFALIFSIGILVDDAIVVVENIVRHWSMRGERGLVETAVEAVAEVGNPTIVATLTIVAALLPMMFVSGMMGPYMSPIPANASIAMLFSFVVAVTVTPWLLLRIAGRHAATIEHAAAIRTTSARSAGSTSQIADAAAERAAALARSSSSRSASRPSPSARCSPPRTCASSCCRSTTSRKSRSCSTCRRARRSRRPTAR